MQLIKYLQLVVLIAVFTYLFSGIQLASSGAIVTEEVTTFHSMGTVIDPSGRTIEFVLDPRGNLVDVTGRVLINATDVSGYVFDPDSGLIVGRVDAAGNISTFRGDNLILTPDTRFVVLNPTSRQMIGIIDTSGHVMPSSLTSARTVIKLPATGIGYLVDPVTLKVKGTMDSSNMLMDVYGNPMSRGDAIGFVVVDPLNGFIKGYINKDKQFIAYKLFAPTVVVAPSTVIASPSTFVTTPGTVIAQPTQTVTETVVTRTTTPTETVVTRSVTPQAITIPEGKILIAVDPLTGQTLGMLDRSLRLPTGVALSSGTLVIDRATGLAIGVINDQGLLVSLESTPVPTKFLSSLDSLRLELDRAIAKGLADGTMTADEAVKLRADLDRVIALESQAKTSQVTFMQALPIANEMRVIERRVVKTTPAIAPARLVIVNGNVQLLDEVGVREFELKARIIDECALGKITVAQRDALLHKMHNIAAIEATYRADGNLDFVESRKLFTAFDRVGSSLDSFIAEFRH